MTELDKLINLYSNIKSEITDRINEFENIYTNSDNTEIFFELAFCLLTPQSKAKSADAAIKELIRTGDIFSDDNVKISDYLNTVRFKNNKAKYIVAARKFVLNNSFDFKNKLKSYSDIKELREWIVKTFKGIGYKEASHFLRNIGFGKKIAILDRHILKNLVLFNVIEEIPKSITKKHYHEIEEKLLKFADEINISPDHLDFLLWYKEAGEVFK